MTQSPLNLLVGDVHAVPEELGDCQALLELVAKAAEQYNVEAITFLGDQYNNHDALSVRCLGFWTRWFEVLNQRWEIWVLRGNHDQSNPTDPFPHALLAHKNTSPHIRIVDGPVCMSPYVVAMPYMYDNDEFVREAQKLKSLNPEAETLLCHQTFAGGKWDNGAPIYDAVNPDNIPFKSVISGHIHRPQRIGNKVTYVGAPRWRTRSDADFERAIYVVDHHWAGTKLVATVKTAGVCRRIWSFDDTSTAPADFSRARLGFDRVLVDVYGPPGHVLARTAELRALGATPRGFPDRAAAPVLRESEGELAAFDRFSGSFVPPNGSATTVLRQQVRDRLGIG